MRIVVAIAALIPALVFAVPGTYTATVGALSQDGQGVAEGYRLFQGCDLAAQTRGAVVADPVVAGQSYTIAGDSDSPPTLCAVPYVGTTEGGFANVVTLAATQLPPGRGTLILQGCQFVTDSGERYACDIQVQ